MSSEQANFTPQNVEEAKGEKVVSTPGQKTVIKSGDAYTVFAVLRRSAATGKTDFLRVDGAGSIQDGERVINLDDIPSQERAERKPKKEREPREKSGVYEKIEKKLHKYVNSNFQEKKQARENESPQEKAERKLEAKERREQKRAVREEKLQNESPQEKEAREAKKLERQERREQKRAERQERQKSLKGDNPKSSGQVQEAHWKRKKLSDGSMEGWRAAP